MPTQRSRSRTVSLLSSILVFVSLAGPMPAAAAGRGGGTVTTSRPVKQPPYYRGEMPAGEASARLPLVMALPAGIPESWLPVAALERLAADMDRWLEQTGAAPLLALEAGGAKVASPAVYLGCSLDEMLDECSEEERFNVLAVTSGTAEWRRVLAVAAGQAGAGRVLVVQLQIAPHWIALRGLKGAKEVRLGSDHVQALPWLTSLDTPVWVVQVTGTVVDGSGEVRRSGAEGIWALRTPFRASIPGAQKLLTEADVERVRTELRRSELPGAPLAWEAALGQLVGQLLGAAPVGGPAARLASGS